MINCLDKNPLFSVSSMATGSGPSVDHAGSASSHFMFVKRRKDETAKEGDLILSKKDTK